MARGLIDPAEIGKMGKSECHVLITGCNPFKSKKYATKEHKRYAWVDPHPEKRPDGKYKAKFDAEAYVRKHAKLREAKKFELLVNDDVGEVWKAE